MNTKIYLRMHSFASEHKMTSYHDDKEFELPVKAGMQIRRATQIFGSEPTKFKFNLQGIGQGSVNSCYLLGSLGAIASVESRIKTIFPEIIFSEIGEYIVYFYINGKSQEFKVDDRFYMKNEDFVYCGCDSTEKLWMPLIEKAWAKAHEGYDKIDRGRSSQCLRELTGAPAFVYDIKDKNC